MYSIEVGQVFPPVVDKGEGVYFDISGSTCTLIYNFNSPTQEEIDAVRANQPFEIRFLQRGNALWILSKCGSLDWTDTAYNPHLSKEVALEHPTEKTLGFIAYVYYDGCADRNRQSIARNWIGESVQQSLY